MTAPSDSVEYPARPAEVTDARRLCFFAHWDPDDIIGDHVLFQLGRLAAGGFTIVLASSSAIGPAEKRKLEPLCADVIVRDNVGLDFGSWRAIHRRYPDVNPELLLLANDSVYGPLVDLNSFLIDLLSHPADFYGLVGSGEYARHAQSWFVLLRPSAYRSEAFKRIMQAPADEISKSDIILRYEVGLTTELEREGLAAHMAYDQQRDGLVSRRRPFNAAHLIWRDLVRTGRSPFIKVELLRDNPTEVDDLDCWRAVVEERAPDLLPAIDAHLRRQRSRVAKRVPMYRRPIVYLPRMRAFLVRDYLLMQAGRHEAARVNWLAFQASYIVLRIFRVPYEVLARLNLLP